MRTKQIMFIAYHAPTNQALQDQDRRVLIFNTAEEARQAAYAPEHPWISNGPIGKRNVFIAKWMQKHGDLQTLKPQMIMMHFGEFLEY